MAFGNNSPTGEKEHKISVTYEFETPEPAVIVTVKDGSEYTLTPVAKDGYEFDRYVIEQTEGTDYEVISKNGSTWKILAKADLTIRVYYKGVKSTPKPVDNTPVSPKTGDNTLMIAGIMLLGLCGVVLASKKLVRN